MFKVYVLKQRALEPNASTLINKRPYELRGRYGNLKQAILSLRNALDSRFEGNWCEDGTFNGLPLFAFKERLQAPSCYVPGLIIQDETSVANLPQVVEKPFPKPKPVKPPGWIDMGGYWELRAKKYRYYAFVDAEQSSEFYYSVEYDGLLIGRGRAESLEDGKKWVIQIIQKHEESR